VNDGEAKILTQCEYFKLETILVEEKSATLDTGGESFHALTVIEGQSQIRAGEEAFILNKFETLLIPAVCGAYQIEPLKKSRILKASV
jgi:mannose-6-phosphate isomerase